MFLKKVKINGFKSFANSVVIDFSAPLTAIVGPNGSGKSNVVDAIRWALGEQSAKSLRGSKMSDIIFGGSADYKPLEKASVTLYFDNSNKVLPSVKKQIRIKRCVSKDGQSDYYMNGSICRLKDIEELLMDTGLGNDSYSIVGQGKIDSILNSKPEKLRELFEEAAGIVKYKNRKQEAKKKLDRTRKDLQRIKDLVWELDKQVKPLKKSAEKAKKYKRLKAELKELEVNLLLDRWEKNYNELKVKRNDKEFLHSKKTTFGEEIDRLGLILEERSNELEIEEDLIEKLKENLYQTKSKREQTENNLKVLEERNTGLLREKKNHQIQLDNISDDIKKINEKGENISEKLLNINSEEKKIKSNIFIYDTDLKDIKDLIKSKKDNLLYRRNSILNENTELNDLVSQLEKSKEKERYLEMEIDKLADKRKNVSEQFDEIILNKKDYSNSIVEIEGELLSKNNELLVYKKKEEEIRNIISSLKVNIEEIKEKINHSRSRLKVLEDMEGDYQGYFQGVKNILREQDNIPGVVGVIADLIDVEKKYELAIETALGARLQNIVTEDDNVAKKAVRFLKSSNGGKATFLPLNMVKGKKARIENLNLEPMDGFLGLASDLINYQGRLEKIIVSILGKTIIAKDLGSAVEISKKIKSKLKIVTLEGEFINSSGAITGGSQINNNRGILGRSREIEELKEEVEKNNDKLKKEMEKKEKANEEKSKLVSLQEEYKEKINKLEFKNNDLNKDILNIQKEQTRLEIELKIIDKDFEDYHKQLGSNDKLLQRLEKKLSIINNEHSKEKDQINHKEQEIKELEIKGEEKNKKLTEIKIEFATITQKKNSIIFEKENLVNDLNNMSIRKEELNQILLGIEDDLLKIENRKEELKRMKDDFTLKIKELSENYIGQQRLFNEKEKAVKELKNKYINRQEDLNKIKDEYHRIELKITRLEDKNIQIADRLMEEYEVSPEEGIPKRITINNYTQVSHKIKEFKDSIKRLGPVNLAAVEEYEELTYRLDYLREQQEDLLKARESIEKVIAELERNMSDLFYQTFVAVKDEFENTFEKLFNGGKAELRLTKPEDLLETGVEIEAQPPGKQLKKLTLMSGGERALTAIALVFAFLKVNPSPIYILDEIDAPLDDANVKRFANYLKEYSQFVQFLLITHNKLMMTEASVIYGITMEEKGVSKLVSLRLDEEIA